jgi:hypothetical protein
VQEPVSAVVLEVVARGQASVAVLELVSEQDPAAELAAEPAALSPCLHCSRTPSRAAMKC